MQNTTELKAFIVSKHKPECKATHMVYQVWEDGEVTLQKGGELWGQRNLHCIKMGQFQFDKDLMPVVETSHGYAIVENMEDADATRQAMLELTKVIVAI